MRKTKTKLNVSQISSGITARRFVLVMSLLLFAGALTLTAFENSEHSLAASRTQGDSAETLKRARSVLNQAILKQQTDPSRKQTRGLQRALDSFKSAAEARMQELSTRLQALAVSGNSQELSAIKTELSQIEKSLRNPYSLWSNGVNAEASAAGQRIIKEGVSAQVFTLPGQKSTLLADVADSSRAVNFVLTWNDAASQPGNSLLGNNLDLEVEINGETYRGNVLRGNLSTTGGYADQTNDLETIMLPAGLSGTFAVRVIASDILASQDYSLAITNAIEAPLAPIVVSAGATLVSESCSPANGALDPGETVTVSFCVQNTGDANTTNLVGTLQATGGVTSPSGPQNYGVVVAGGPAVCRNFTFNVSGTCGGTITATIQFQDGATNLGSVTYTFTLGVQNVVFSENFDGVTAPALPAGWVSSFTNGAANCTPTGTCALGSNWTTVNTLSDTAPNSAFHNDPSCVTNNTLDTPNISITTTSAQLTFRNNFNLESGFDGAVLEVSSPNINGGAFTDITNAAVGGSFVTGGYNATISVNFLSPIAGRQAWSGNSGGFITTTANLGPNVAGQTIKLRFRFASDCSVSGTRHNIDTIRITDGFTCCTPACTITCPANITVSNDPNQCGAVVTYPAPTTMGACGTVTCSPASGSFFPKGTTPVTCTSSAGPSCSFTITVNDTQPPTITCPTNVTAVSPNPMTGTVVTYPPPTASDNCPGVTVVCNPPSGSTFPPGVTTVTCTATDTSGNTATCSFTVTTFDAGLQDDGGNGVLLWNSTTGAYRFCAIGGTTFTGVGTATVNGTAFSIVHNAADRRLNATFDNTLKRGSGAFQFISGHQTFTITDRNTLNDTFVCP
ncbi:MAG TPA: HYR domain-containing protein [Pyrinomonadaceae bacterium]|nr:HYR domain-containing protein [Pyrinomonadaceae bacterium]